jgi:hypothetical protein
MKKFLSLAIFALLACISTFAQTPPGGYGPGQGGNSTATIVAVSQNGPPGVVNPYAYGAKYNAHFNAAPSFTNTLNTVNCAGCNFTGTDALGRPIASVGQVVFGSNTTTDVSQATSVFITPECGIATIVSATQITMGVIGSLGTACNATATTTASGFLFWGNLDSNTSAGGAQSAANDPIYGAWTAAATNCIPYHHPAGVTLVERQEWNTYPTTTGSCGSPNSIPATRQGFTVTGEGDNASIVIITPNFNATNECVGPNAGSIGCFLSVPNVVMHDWQLWGAGNSAGGLSGKAGILIFGISPGINFEISRMQINGWGAATAGFYGLNVGNGVASGVAGGTISQTNIEAFGYYTCYMNPSSGTFTATVFADGLWCTVGATTLTVNGGVFSSVNGIYGWTLVTFGASSAVNAGGLGVAFSCQAGAYCNSTNDTLPYNGTVSGAGEFYCLGSAGTSTRCNIENDTIATSESNAIGILLYETGAAGPVVQVNNTIVTAPYDVYMVGCSTSCRYASVGGNIYTASTTGYTSATNASVFFSPTDTFSGFGTTIQTTIAGTGACSTVSTEVAITTTGIVTCTAVGGAATLVLTPLFTAPHGWYCSAADQTTAADTFRQSASTTTTCTVSSAAVAQNDVVSFNTVPY